MLDVWPASLPQYLLVDGYAEAMGDGRLRSQTDMGPAKVRRRSSFMPSALSGVMRMTREQIATLTEFVDVTLAGGSLPFMFPDPLTRYLAMVRFADRLPSRGARSGLLFDVALDLEVHYVLAPTVLAENQTLDGDTGVIVKPLTSLPFNYGEGTLYFEAQAEVGATEIALANLDGGALNQAGTFRFSVEMDGEYFYYQPPVGLEGSIRRWGAAVDLTNPVRVAFSWKDTAVVASVNGLPAIAGTLPAPASTFGFERLILGTGSWLTPAEYLMVKAVLDPRGMTAAEVEAMTS